jgi:endogenous inhibitor of DNA gyrase (YacG/DUF329 family)
MTDKINKPCPLCGKPASDEHRPFCSRGCANRDLLAWLGESYVLPGENAAPNADDGDGRDDY